MTLQQFGIAYCLLLIALMLFGMWLEKKLTRKWPQGHGNSYFWRPTRRTDTD